MSSPTPSINTPSVSSPQSVQSSPGHMQIQPSLQSSATVANSNQAVAISKAGNAPMTSHEIYEYQKQVQRQQVKRQHLSRIDSMASVTSETQPQLLLQQISHHQQQLPLLKKNSPFKMSLKTSGKSFISKLKRQPTSAGEYMSGARAGKSLGLVSKYIVATGIDVFNFE